MCPLIAKDSASKRSAPWRLQAHFPDENGRLEILRILTKNMKLHKEDDETVDLLENQITKKT
jgi:ATP-dependent 26S proteasome regulatory subunit